MWCNRMEKTSVLNGNPYHDMAVIMTVYRDFKFIKRNLDFLHDGFDIYIHVDRKTIIPDSILDSCRNLKNVWIDNTFRINWGAMST